METLITFIFFILGVLTLHGFANKILSQCGIPRQNLIPSRILLSILFYSVSISLSIYNKNVMFGTGWGLGLLYILPFGIILTFISSYTSNKEQILNNWWKNIIYATISAFSIWLITREPQGKNGIILMFIPLIALFTTILHFLILLVHSFIRKHFKKLAYCLVFYAILAIAYFSFAGYRNFAPNYTLQEAQNVQAFLWEYEVNHTNKTIPDSLKLQIKDAYAERYYSYQYDSWFSYSPTIHIGKSYYINLIFDKKIFVENKPNFVYHYDYHNMLRCNYDTIPPTDSICLPFTYSLTLNGRTVTDTLLLVKKGKNPNQQQRK